MRESFELWGREYEGIALRGDEMKGHFASNIFFNLFFFCGGEV